MPRANATIVLLLLAAMARASGIAVAVRATPGELSVATLLASVEVLALIVAALLHAADRVEDGVASSATLGLAAMAIGNVMSIGITAINDGVPITQVLLLLLTASACAGLAGATVIGRWQDHGAPTSDGVPLMLRGAALLGAVFLGATLVTGYAAVMGRVAVEGGSLPGPVAIAATFDAPKLPLLLGVLLVTAWVTARAGTRHVVAVSLALGTRAVVELGRDLQLRDVALPMLPLLLSIGATVLLCIAVPALAARTRRVS